MPKLTLAVNPTFSAKVAVPVAGGDLAEVVFTFRHRTKTELDKFVTSRDGVDDVDSFMDMVVGWDLDEPFTRENVKLLLENYIGSAVSTLKVYIDELVKSKLGN